MEDNNSTINAKTLEIPVIFYDGEREIDLGKVQIIPLMTFKILQSTLSNKIGISPNHITIYLDRNANNNLNNHHNHHHRRRHPVTSKFDFAALREGGCIFWVVLKRGRRNRRRHNGKNDVVKNGPVLILPRGVGIGISEFENWEYLEYVNRLRMIDQIEREKERYLMSLNLNSNVYNELSAYNNHHQPQQHFPDYHNYDNYNNNINNNNNKSSSSNYSDDYYNYDGVDVDVDVDMASCSSSTGGASSETTRVYCDICYNSDADTVPFHWCKNDVVVTARTRSRVGPIAPPLKNSLST